MDNGYGCLKMHEIPPLSIFVFVWMSSRDRIFGIYSLPVFTPGPRGASCLRPLLPKIKHSPAISMETALDQPQNRFKQHTDKSLSPVKTTLFYETIYDQWSFTISKHTFQQKQALMIFSKQLYSEDPMDIPVCSTLVLY